MNKTITFDPKTLVSTKFNPFDQVPKVTKEGRHLTDEEHMRRVEEVVLGRRAHQHVDEEHDE